MHASILLLAIACAQDRSAPPTPPHPDPAPAAAAEPAFVPDSLGAAMALGDCERALVLLPPQPGPAERLAAAHCQIELGRPAEALDQLEQVDGLLADHAAWFRARALRALDRPAEEVTAALEGVALPGEAGLRLQLLRAELSGDVAELRRLASTSIGAEATYRAALLAEGADREAALRALWVRGQAPWDALAVQALGGEPPLDTAAGRELARDRITSLKAVNRHEEALALLERLVAVEGTVEASQLVLARARFTARAYDEALVSWRAALGPPERATGAPQDLFDYALSFARVGDYDTAAVVYRRLMAEHPKSSQADFASYKLGYMAFDASDCEAAVPLLRQHAADRPRSRHLDEALWFEARCHWRADDPDAASAAWARLIEATPSSSLVSGAHYWLARARGMKGDAEAERQGLTRVLERFPDTAYAWFAAEALDRTFPSRPAVEPPPFPDELAADPNIARAQALTAVGLRTLARSELAEVEAEGREAQLALAWARHAAGDYRGGQALARPYCGNPWEAGDPVAQQACWPRPERELVEGVADRHPIPELLPYAIMTAESGLDPTVTSAAGARGLMQLMPEVGAEVHAEVFGDDRYDPARLYSAPYNAILGTSELGRRARSLEGVLEGSELPAVIASYNAGEEAVRRWIESGEGTPRADEFAEDVSYTETRQYVKRVLGYTMAWRHVYGD